MAVKGSKNTKQHATKTKAEMMGKESAQEESTKSDESQKLENLPKTSKEKSEAPDKKSSLH
jgi:predicted phage gp36 major capsid-like protein